MGGAAGSARMPSADFGAWGRGDTDSEIRGIGAENGGAKSSETHKAGSSGELGDRERESGYWTRRGSADGGAGTP